MTTGSSPSFSPKLFRAIFHRNRDMLTGLCRAAVDATVQFYRTGLDRKDVMPGLVVVPQFFIEAQQRMGEHPERFPEEMRLLKYGTSDRPTRRKGAGASRYAPTAASLPCRDYSTCRPPSCNGVRPSIHRPPLVCGLAIATTRKLSTIRCRACHRMLGNKRRRKRSP